MSREVLWPHTLIESDAVQFFMWEWSVEGSSWAAVDEPIHSWDRRTEVQLRNRVELNLDTFEGSSVLAEDEVPWLVTILDCPETQERISRRARLRIGDLHEETLMIPAGTMRGRVQIERHIVAGAEDGPSGRRLIPSPNVVALQLEENPDRFPIEAFSFRAVRGLPPIEWKVRIESGQHGLWNSPFRDAVELWVNTDQKEIADALTRSEHELHPLYLRLVERDITRTLFDLVAADKSFQESDGSVEPASVGESLTVLAQGRLKMQVDEYLALLEGDVVSAVTELHRALPLANPDRSKR